MRILIDTNILIDFIVKRQPFSDDAEKVIDLCMGDNIKSCIAAHSIPTIAPQDFIKQNDVVIEKP